MTKVEILALVKELARQPDLDADTLDIYYDDIIEDIAKSPSHPLVSIELFNILSGTFNYLYDASAVKLLAVFAGTRQLLPASTTDMGAYDKDWRNLTGSPFAFTEGERTAREIALIPIPDNDSTPILGPSPFGEDYPDYIGVQLYAIKRDDNIPDWIALFVCMKILAKEYGHPSSYQDKVFSDYCDKLAEILWRAAGL